MPCTRTGCVTLGGPCSLFGMQCLPLYVAMASVITPLLSRTCGLASYSEPGLGHQGTVLALALLFNLRVYGGFSLGLSVPLLKGVADSLGHLAKGPVCVCVCVHVCNSSMCVHI